MNVVLALLNTVTKQAVLYIDSASSVASELQCAYVKTEACPGGAGRPKMGVGGLGGGRWEGGWGLYSHI